MIIRVKKGEDPYVRIDKVPINDTRLSWKARGLLLYLLSKPDDWKVRIEHLITQAPDGERAVRSGIKELIEAGYMVKIVKRGADGSSHGSTTCTNAHTCRLTRKKPRSRKRKSPEIHHLDKTAK